MNGKRLANRIVKECLSMGAEDLCVIDVRKKTPFFDFIVVATVDNAVLADAILRRLDRSIELDPGAVTRMESAAESTWFVLDFGDLFFHLFVGEEIRKRYDLEALWSETPRLHSEESAAAMDLPEQE